MRREDKNKLPPRLKVKLPGGYYLERYPGGYSLYRTETWGAHGGTLHTLVMPFKADTPPNIIESYAVGRALGQWLTEGGTP